MKKYNFQIIGYVCSFLLTILSINVNGQAFFDNTFDAETNLPVRLLSITAQRKQANVDVYWVTATETNNSHFEIERSFNGENFETVGTVNGNGNSITEKKYHFVDQKVPNVTLFYRLRQFDFDGRTTVSQIVVIKSEISREGKISLFPNPVPNQTISLAFENVPTGNYTITITGMNGATIYEKAFNHGLPTEVTQLYLNSKPARGMYIVKISNGSEVSHQKVIIE